jgi:C4-dicarboxylate-specific signal transduction histidine kinase
MHPTIAYLVGTLRHELLKHRVGVLGALVSALERGKANEGEIELTVRRVLTGDPLEAAFAEHARAFERALGGELSLDRDASFRGATKAIRALARTLRTFDPARRADTRTLAEAHATLTRFDRDLAELASRLTRTRLDRGLVEAVLRDLASEHRAGSVKLDALEIDVPDEALDIPIFRVDLVVVLRNLVRNAMLAAGSAPAPRAVHVDVRVELEPTGEEIVRLRIHDSDPTTLSPEVLRERPIDRGLGLVSAAIARYDGALSTEPSDRGLGKAVVVRFFRCMEPA